MRKIAVISGICLLLGTVPVCYAACEYNQAATVANTLNLTPCQAKQKEELDKKRYLELDIKTSELEQETYVLKALQQGKVSEDALASQKKIVKNLENDIKNINEQYDKNLYCLLTNMQKNKLKTINRLEKRDAKHSGKRLFKPDPNYRTFGIKEECR